MFPISFSPFADIFHALPKSLMAQMKNDFLETQYWSETLFIDKFIDYVSPRAILVWHYDHHIDYYHRYYLIMILIEFFWQSIYQKFQYDDTITTFSPVLQVKDSKIKYTGNGFIPCKGWEALPFF